MLLLDECPWMTPTTQNDVMQCRDGTFCNVKTDAAKFECCKSHNGRGKCPKNAPLMCANKKCDGNTDYCCHGSNQYKNCYENGHGGPRPCTNEICNGATHQDLTGSGIRDVEITTYSGITELEKDSSCCTKCNKRGDCEYWVRATDSNKCWLKSNDGNAIQEVASNTRRGGLKTMGSLHCYLYLSRYHISIIWNFLCFNKFFIINFYIIAKSWKILTSNALHVDNANRVLATHGL